MNNPGHSLELSIVNYLSGSAAFSTASLLSGSGVSFYHGYDNLDVINPPVCIVDCNEYNELYFNTRNFEFLARIFVKEMAPDTSGSNLGIIAESVLNEFVNSNSAVQNFSNPAYNIAVWQCQPFTIRSERSGDALITEAMFRMIGALVPSS